MRLEACSLLSRSRSSFEFTVTRLFIKLFRITSPAVAKCCQLLFDFLPVHSQLYIRTVNILQTFIASENNLCYLFSLTARRKLDELVVQFDNATTACQFHNAILDSLTCINDALSSEAPAFMFSLCLLPFWRNKVEYDTKQCNTLLV